MTSLGFVGLGAMGSRMARRLLDAGYQVIGYNRTPEKARPLVSAGLRLAPTPRDVAAASEVVFSMVTDTGALQAITQGEHGLVAGLRRGATFVDMSTVSPLVVRELESVVTGRNAALLDAAVSGSTLTVEQGQASIVAAGELAVLERVRPYLSAIGPTITHVGPLGLAKTMKIAMNLGLAVQMLAFSEAVLLAEKAGIARERAVDAITKSVVASPMVRYRGPFVIGGMPRHAWFNVPMMQKDVELALDLGHRLGVSLPSTALAQQYLTMARGLGLGGEDFAVLFDVLASMAARPPATRPGP